MLKVCSGGTNEEEEGVYKRFGRLRPEGSRSELGGPAVGSVDVGLVSLSLKKLISPLGGSASPLIDEEDGFTGKRRRVQIFLSLAAYGDIN